MHCYTVFVFLFLTLFHSVEQAPVSPTSLEWAQMHSFSQLSNSPPCIYTTTFLSIHLQWISRLLPCPSYRKYSWDECWCTCVSFSSAFLGVYASSGIAGSCNGSISKFLRPHMVYCGYTSFHSYQQCKLVTFPLPPQRFLFETLGDGHCDQCEMTSHYGIDFHLPDNEWCWAFALCSLAICISSLEKCLFSSSAQFLIGLFVFLLLSCMSCLYMWEINSWAVVWFVVICSSSEGCPFTWLIVSFTLQKLRSFNQSLLFPSVFISLTLAGGT